MARTLTPALFDTFPSSCYFDSSSFSLGKEVLLIKSGWGFAGCSMHTPSEGLKEFIKTLSGFDPEIMVISDKRIVLLPFHKMLTEDRMKSPGLLIYEGPAEEMEPLITIAGWYRESRNNPVFVRMKSRTDFSFGLSSAELSAN